MYGIGKNKDYESFFFNGRHNGGSPDFDEHICRLYIYTHRVYGEAPRNIGHLVRQIEDDTKYVN